MRIPFFTMLIGFILLLCFGCGTGPFQKSTSLDRNWGMSYEIARTQQILNPDAGKNPEPVEGLDGNGSLRCLEHYREGFEQADKASTASITMTPSVSGN